MKKTRYDVIYLNGNEETFYAFGFVDAIIYAFYYATSKGWDNRIKYITDENGTNIEKIQYPTFTYTK